MNEKTLVSAAITACVAQLVEQRIRNAQVAGSSPAASSRVLPKFRRDFYFSYMYKSKRGSVGTLVRRRAFRRPTARRAALRPEMSSAFVMRRSPVRVRPQAPKCVDERCNAENAARKCGVFAYNALLLEWKSCKDSIFQNFSFALREATFLRCALPNLWIGVVRTPRLKNKENQQPLYHPPLFWRVRQRLFLSDGSRTHNLKWAL